MDGDARNRGANDYSDKQFIIVMRKLLICIGALFAAVIAFTGCSSDHEDEPELIVCSFPSPLFESHVGYMTYDSLCGCRTIQLYPLGLSARLYEFWFGDSVYVANDSAVVLMPIDDSFYKSASDSLPCEEGVPIRFRFREIAWGPAVPLSLSISRRISAGVRSRS